MEKIDFLIIGTHYSDRPGFYKNLVETFSLKGFKAGFITACYEEYQELSNKGVFSKCLPLEIKISNKMTDKILEEECSKLENKYDIPSLRDFVFTEMCYYGEPREYLLRKAVEYFKWVEGFFREHQVGCVIQKQGGEIHRRVIFHISHRLGIPVIYFGQSLFPGKILLHSNEMNKLEDFCLQTWKEISSKDKEWCEKYIGEFRVSKRVFKYHFTENLEPRFVRLIRKLNLYGGKRDWRRLKIAIRKRFDKYIGQKINRAVSKVYYSTPSMDYKYIYFPFHVPNDTQITIRNPQFFDQEFLAKYIARCLPVGYKLYVKEHPGSFLTIRSKNMILKENNVILCNPNINSHDLIQHAKAIIIINSTVGFESLLYFKPIIVVGNWMLKGNGITYDVSNLFDLSKTTKDALSVNLNKIKIKEFLISLKCSSWDGSIYEHEIKYEVIVDSLIKKLSKLRRSFHI